MPARGKDTVASLRARLARLEREASARERQLERYASDLRDIFEQERRRVARGAGIEVDPQVEFGFLLHDVGKVAVPDAILFKPGALTEEEMALVRRHPETGSEILGHIDFLGEAKAVVRHHHDRWDGDGYPDGLAGESIPMHARVFALADTLDALTSDRPYRAATTWSEARKVIRADSGTQFDPAIVSAYESVPDEAFVRLREGIA